MFKLIALFAMVAYASAGAVSPYVYGHGIAPAVSYAPSVSYHAPLATSYANTYKVAYAAPAVTKVIAAPTVTKIAYATPSVAYSAPLAYGHGYGLGYGHGSVYGLGSYGHGYGNGYGGYGGYGYGGLGYGYGHGYYH